MAMTEENTNISSEPRAEAQKVAKALQHPLASPNDSGLIAALDELASKAGKLVKSQNYAAPSDPDIQVKSWKMNEFKYYDVPSPFPTLARGLFTYEVDDDLTGEGSDSKASRIVARGYDKFFNIGEVPWTTVSFYPSDRFMLADLSSSGIPSPTILPHRTYYP